MRKSGFAALVAVPALLVFAAPLSGQSTPPAPQLDDATIVAIFDAANTADIETGALAAEKGTSQAVRDYGAMLARDHAAVRQMGRDLAARLGVTPTPPADDASARTHAAAMKSLRAASGHDFDHAFLQHEIAFHQGVIDALNASVIPAIDNPELKALVLKVAPAFEAHKQAAKQIDAKLAESAR